MKLAKRVLALALVVFLAFGNLGDAVALAVADDAGAEAGEAVAVRYRVTLPGEAGTKEYQKRYAPGEAVRDLEPSEKALLGLPEGVALGGWYLDPGMTQKAELKSGAVAAREGLILYAAAQSVPAEDEPQAEPDEAAPEAVPAAESSEAASEQSSDAQSSEPTVEEPAVEEAAPVEKPDAESGPVAEPVAQEPAADEPAAEEPAAEEPVAEEPAAEEPVAEEPAAEEPAVEEPVVEEPAEAEPIAEEPGIAPLSLSAPVTVRLHYRRSDNNYTGWGVWAWEDGKQGTHYKFETEEGEVVATIPVRAGLTRINYFVYKIDGSDWIKDVTNNGNGDQIMDLTDRADTYDVYVQSGEWGFSTEEPSDVTVRIHYSRPKEDYAGWYVWYWEQGRAAEHGGPSGLVGGASVPFDPKDGEAVATIKVNQGVSQLGYIIYQNELDEKNKDIKLDQFINISGLTGTYDVYVTSGVEGYVPEEKEFTVRLHNGDEVTTKTVLEGESFTPAAPEKTGCEFSGWATEESGPVVYEPSKEITVNEDMDLYAVWEVKMYQQTFYAYVDGLTVEQVQRDTVTLKGNIRPTDDKKTWIRLAKNDPGVVIEATENPAITKIKWTVELPETIVGTTPSVTDTTFSYGAYNYQNDSNVWKGLQSEGGVMPEPGTAEIGFMYARARGTTSYVRAVGGTISVDVPAWDRGSNLGLSPNGNHDSFTEFWRLCEGPQGAKAVPDPGYVFKGWYRYYDGGVSDKLVTTDPVLTKSDMKPNTKVPDIIDGNQWFMPVFEKAGMTVAGGEWEYDYKTHYPTVTFAGANGGTQTADELGLTLQYRAGDGAWSNDPIGILHVAEGPKTVYVRAVDAQGVVVFGEQPAVLTVTPHPITLKSNDVTANYTANPTGFTSFPANGGNALFFELQPYSGSGGIIGGTAQQKTDVGTYKENMTFVVNWRNPQPGGRPGIYATDYEVTYEYGDLIINPRVDKVKQTLKVPYTGERQFLNIDIVGEAHYTNNKGLYAREELTATLSALKPGIYTVKGVDDKAVITGDGAEFSYQILKSDGQTDSTGNYDITFDLTLEITKAEADAYETSLSIDGWAYGDEPNAPEASVTDGPGHEDYGEPAFLYSADGQTWTEEVPTDVGEYVVKAVWAGSDSLPELEKLVVFTITQADAKDAFLVSEAPTDHVYDGAEHKWAPVVTDSRTNAELVEGEDYTVTYDTEDFVSANSKITVTIAGRGSYTGEIKTSYKIAKRPIFLLASNLDAPYTYNGQEQTVEATTDNTIDWVNAPDWVDKKPASGDYYPLVDGHVIAEILKPFSITAKNWTPGFGKSTHPVTNYVKLVNQAGEDVSGNYTGYLQVEIAILRKNVTVTADSKRAAYGGEVELTATVEGLEDGDTLDYSLEQTPEGSDVGSYTITPTGKRTQGSYTVTYVEGTLTIDPVVDVTVTNGSFAAESNGYGAYNGTADRVGVATGEDQTITFTANAGMALESVTVDGEEAALAADGSYTFEDVTENHSIVVVFSADSDGDGTPDAAETNDITVTVTGGTADPAESPITVAFGEDQTITFTAAPGMALESVTMDGQPAELAEDGSYTFENVTEPHSIAVAYAEEGGDEPAGPEDPAGPENPAGPGGDQPGGDQPGGGQPGGDQPGGGQPGGGQPGGGQPGGGQPGGGQPGGGAGADGGAGAGDDAGNADDAGDADADAGDADGGAAVIDEDDTPLADTPTLPEGQNQAPAEIEEDETPLADGPSGEECCILHLLIMLGALAVGVYYTHDRKKRQEEAFETSARLL